MTTITDYEALYTDDAEWIILAYGGMARSARAAVKALRKSGVSVGLFRPITLWPFPEKALSALSDRVRGILVTELNYGQIKLEVERIVRGRCSVEFLGNGNGEVIVPRSAGPKNLRRCSNESSTCRILF